MPWLEGRPISELFGNIVANIQEIIRSEVRLAKVEVREEATKAASSFKVLGIGLFLGLYALGFLLLAAMFALALVMEFWQAALIVGGGMALIAAVLVSAGLKRLQHVHQPQKTIETIKENVQWAKHQIKSNDKYSRPDMSSARISTSYSTR
jgi:uncharacterized membrane protein YqjE